MASEIDRPFDSHMYAFLNLMVRLGSCIPFRVCQFLGRMLGGAFSLIVLGRTEVSLHNLGRAFKDSLSEREIRRLNRRVITHFGEMFFEIPHILRLNSENLERYVRFENEENLLSAQAKGKGVFILTGHFGNWELMSAATCLRYAPRSAVVARPLDFSPADRLMADLRSRFGTVIIPKQGAVKGILKVVKQRGMVGILLDQNVAWYEGVFVPFFGNLACTNKGLALLALKTGAPVVPVFSVRDHDGRYRVIFEKEVNLIRTGDMTRDVEENTALFTKIIERFIREYPDHWFWFHKRWKTRPFSPLP